MIKCKVKLFYFIVLTKQSYFIKTFVRNICIVIYTEIKIYQVIPVLLVYLVVTFLQSFI